MRRESAEIKTDRENREVEGFPGMLKKKGCYALRHLQITQDCNCLRNLNVKVRDAEN